jgi:hypothetical protein
MAVLRAPPFLGRHRAGEAHACGGRGGIASGVDWIVDVDSFTILSTFPKSCSTSNSGVWTPIVTRPCSLYFSAQARICGARSQPVDARERPEVHEDDMPAQVVRREGLRVEPPLAPSSEGMRVSGCPSLKAMTASRPPPRPPGSRRSRGPFQRSDANAARISSEKSAGSSQAAK